MSYKTELHCHTPPVSPCAHGTPEELIEQYTLRGYRTVVLTNHFHAYTFRELSEDWKCRADYYLSGYHTLVRLAENSGLSVLLGAEITMEGSMNDYLVYGLEEPMLYEMNEAYTWGLPKLREFADAHNLLVYQAHPFRFNMTLIRPDDLDGYEIYNSRRDNPGHSEMAQQWAKIMGKPGISGSDYHSVDQGIGGGIYTDEPVTSMAMLRDILRDGNYSLICE